MSAMILVQSQKIVKRKQKNALVKLATKELSVINVQKIIGRICLPQPSVSCIFQSTIDLLLFVYSRVRSRYGSWGFTLFPLTDDRNRN